MDVSGEAQEPVSFRYDPAQLPQLAQLVDQACDGVVDIYEAGVRVSRLAAQASPEMALAVVAQLKNLFCYLITQTPAGSSQPGARLEPFDGPSPLPPALRDADQETRTLWVALANTVTHPVARARCHDIAFMLRLADNRHSAEQAVRAYLEMAAGSLRPRERSMGLLRAWTLIRAVGLNGFEPQARTAMLDLADSVISSADDPHAALPLLEALTAAGPRKGAPQSPDPRAHALLDQALTAYPQPFIVAEFAALVRARSADDPVRFEHASRVQINAQLAEANASKDGFRLRVGLNDAASLARKFGIKDLEQQATAQLQAAPPVEWAVITSPDLTLPAFYVNTYLHPYRHAQSWQEALTDWFHSKCPSGRHEGNVDVAQKTFQQSVILRLATHVRFGQDDLPKRVSTGDDDALAAELVRLESLNIAVHGALLGSALDLIAARFSIPSQEDLAAFITSYGTRPALAQALATSLRLYWAREYSASAHLATPKIEAAARALLLALNEPIYRSAVGDNVGQFAGLGVLLQALAENGFDPDWERFLRTFLLSDGDSIRNLVAHGFMDDVSRDTAALVLRACALMILIAGDDAASRDSEAVRTALAHPVAATRRRPRWRRVTNAARAAYLEMRR